MALVSSVLKGDVQFMKRKDFPSIKLDFWNN